MKDFLLSKTSAAVKFVPLEMSPERPKIDARYVRGEDRLDIFFGWNLLNTHIDMFVKRNSGLAFIGPHHNNSQADVLAAYGADYYELGDVSADFLVDRFLLGGTTLGNLEIQMLHKPTMQINKERLQHFGFTLGKECLATEML